jgi:hypothetical protein
MPARNNPYTQRSLRRRIKAARAEGLVVVRIAPDYSVITFDPNSGHSPPQLSPGTPHPGLTAQPELRDAREKLG